MSAQPENMLTNEQNAKTVLGVSIASLVWILVILVKTERCLVKDNNPARLAREARMLTSTRKSAKTAMPERAAKFSRPGATVATLGR